MEILVNKEVEGLMDSSFGFESPVAFSGNCMCTVQVIIEDKDNYDIPDTIESKELDNGNLLINLPGTFTYNKFYGRFNDWVIKEIEATVDSFKKKS